MYQLKQANQVYKLIYFRCSVEGDLVEWNIPDPETLNV